MRISQISLVCIYISLIFVYPYKIAASGEESIEIPQSEKKSVKESATPAEKTAQYYIDLGNKYSRMGLKYSNIPDRKRANAESKKAAAAYQKALELEPENIRIYRMLSGAYSNSQQENKAIEITEKAIKLQPGNLEPYYRRAFVWGRKGIYTNAIKDFSFSCFSGNKVAALRRISAADL